MKKTFESRMHNNHGWALPLAAALLIGVTALIYWPAVSHQLLDWDDTTYVTGNPKMADLRAVWGDWSKGYMPATETPWQVVYRNFGGLPGPYHILNICFHLLNVLLVYILLRQLAERWQGRKPGDVLEAAPALLGAALFAWHPIQVEAVCWVTSLKDLASAFFCLIALNAHGRFLDAQPKAAFGRNQIFENGGRTCGEPIWERLGPASPSNFSAKMHHVLTKRSETSSHPRVWYWLGVIAFGLAMLAKPTAIAMLLAAFIMGRIFYARVLARSIRDVLPWLAIALFPLAVSAFSQAKLYQDFDVSLRYRLFIALDAFGFYCGKVLWPWEFLPAYGRSPRWLIDSGLVWWTWIPAAGFLALAAWRRRQWPGLWLGVCVTVLAILPVSGLLQFAAQNNSTVYDHYLYLGMAGPAIALAWLTCRRSWPRWTFALIAVGLLALAIKSTTQTFIWRDDRALWTYTLTHRPESEVALVSMGKLFAAQGDYTKARDYYEQALRAAPWSVEAHNNLGACLARLGQLDPAREHFEKALKLNPGLIAAHDNLAEYWLARERWDQAEPYIRYVLERQANHVGANSKMAEHLLRTGQARECIRLLKPVARSIPGHANLYNLLGAAYGQNGQRPEAVSAFQTALRLDPGHAGAARNLSQAQQTRK